MKLNVLVYLSLFFASNMMANDVCMPEDICLLIENDGEEFAIACDKIIDYQLITFIRPSDEIEITLDPQLNLSEIVKNKDDEEFFLQPYIFGRQLNKIGLRNINLNKLTLSLYRDEQVFSSKYLINCIDELKKVY
ncbi:hypothetical protein [Providencia sp. JUb39]|uniref:hypothetical protein n=1 Tax=Providencia sp. JUb39 TaxID=2724165 RepID=UPI00164D7154|nr:hypothetical protein [Providencia sp. JUb39]MBC5791444.1 hypothetical protein [Providencia sp. JUb39]